MTSLEKLRRTALILGFLAGLSLPADADVLKAGDWRVFTKATAPKYEKEVFSTTSSAFSDPFTAVHYESEIMLAWGEAKPDKWGNKPVKYILLFSVAPLPGNPFETDDDTRAWWEGRGKDQAAFFIECGPEVHQFKDRNAHNKGWSYAYLLLEYANGKRALQPFTGQIKLKNGGNEVKDESTQIVAPEDYQWSKERLAAR